VFWQDWMETTAWVGPVCTAPSLAEAIAHWR